MQPDADPRTTSEPPADAGAEPSASSTPGYAPEPPGPPDPTAPVSSVTTGPQAAPSPGPAGQAPPPAPKRPASIALLVVITALSLAADLTTKAWAKGHLDGIDAKSHTLRRIDVWKGYVELIFARNPGGAWSFLRSLPDSLRRPFFLVVSAAAIVFIITIYRRVHREQWAMKLGLPLALGGAAGNLVDRIRYGWVVDFIDFSMKWGGEITTGRRSTSRTSPSWSGSG